MGKTRVGLRPDGDGGEVRSFGLTDLRYRRERSNLTFKLICLAVEVAVHLVALEQI